MPDTDETDSYEMLCEDWGSAYLITRAPGTARPCRASPARRPSRHPGRRQPRRAAGADPRGLPGPPRPPGGGTVTLPAEPPAVTEPAHPVHALTTSELRRYQRDLEQAIAGIAAGASRKICAASSAKSWPSRNHGPGSSTPAGKAPGPVTAAPPGNLTAIVFRALYREFDLITIGVLHIVTPKGTPVFIGDSLGDLARQISAASPPDPGPAHRGQPRQTGRST